MAWFERLEPHQWCSWCGRWKVGWWEMDGGRRKALRDKPRSIETKSWVSHVFSLPLFFHSTTVSWEARHIKPHLFCSGIHHVSSNDGIHTFQMRAWLKISERCVCVAGATGDWVPQSWSSEFVDRRADLVGTSMGRPVNLNS